MLNLDNSDWLFDSSLSLILSLSLFLFLSQSPPPTYLSLRLWLPTYLKLSTYLSLFFVHLYHN